MSYYKRHYPHQKFSEIANLSETDIVTQLIDFLALTEEDKQTVSAQAAEWVQDIRDNAKPTLMETFLLEYGLSTQEGIALMGLMEAMPRVTDKHTMDTLIRDKIVDFQWGQHLGNSSSKLINLSSFFLLLTHKILHEKNFYLARFFRYVIRPFTQPIIRYSTKLAIKQVGAQFVLGQTIQEALRNGQKMSKPDYCYSFDMLGEAAKTEAEAQDYFNAYENAIMAIASYPTHETMQKNHGISVKLSALHSRFEWLQKPEMQTLLTQRILHLAEKAAHNNMGLNIDAEEADKLEFTLYIFEKILQHPPLKKWNGLGLVVQAYNKHADAVLDYIYQLAKKYDRKIMVRLVKGAYWDTEIKHAQVLGLDNYSVFTCKSHTDISYMAAAKKLLMMGDYILPQFATHNAHSVNFILYYMKKHNIKIDFEFQRLHGMGENLYEKLKEESNVPCRIYAPVGLHRDLLAYLVRRMLENGANSSFVHKIIDKKINPEIVVKDPVADFKNNKISHPLNIPPHDFLPDRKNSQGWDFQDATTISNLAENAKKFASPYIWYKNNDGKQKNSETSTPIYNPANKKEIVGYSDFSDAKQAQQVLSTALCVSAKWEKNGAHKRAEILYIIADLYEEHADELMALCRREAGKNIIDAIAELREAVDFLRYYACMGKQISANTQPRGVIICISPWNFPLAIFTGQIAAALMAGNTVLAKPASTTPLIAKYAIGLMHQAGVPKDVLHYLPIKGKVLEETLLGSDAIGGVCFTGSTQVAQTINRKLATHAPHAMLIAETGGLNAMIVDSTALMQQAVTAIIESAFQSAGQRCSALRILYIQEDVRDACLQMLCGAMDMLKIGNPWHLTTDIGPVIAANAYREIMAYIDTKKSSIIKQVSLPNDAETDKGYFIPPTLIAIDGIAHLDKEIFGPVLHIATFKNQQLPDIITEINTRGYGLTLGLHSRINSREKMLINNAHIGNIYINRNQIGAIVGCQPFGGEGLSGTGPKAGGEHYITKFRILKNPLTAQPFIASVAAKQLNKAEFLTAKARLNIDKWANFENRVTYLSKLVNQEHIEYLEKLATFTRTARDLPAPTGEVNQYRLFPKGIILCLGISHPIGFQHILSALAMGNGVICIEHEANSFCQTFLDDKIIPLLAFEHDLDIDNFPINHVNAIAMPARHPAYQPIRQKLAMHDGTIIPVITENEPFISFCTQRCTCIDITATGGNPDLLNIA